MSFAPSSAAHRADIDLDFDRAAAIDLAGRNVLDAVRTSVSPKVIDCPDPQLGGKTTLSAVAKKRRRTPHPRTRDGPHESVAVDRWGEPKKRSLPRVGQGIVSAIGAAGTHMDVLRTPDRISRSVLERGSGTGIRLFKSSRSISQTLVSERTSERAYRPIRPKRICEWPRREPRCVVPKRSRGSKK